MERSNAQVIIDVQRQFVTTPGNIMRAYNGTWKAIDIASLKKCSLLANPFGAAAAVVGRLTKPAPRRPDRNSGAGKWFRKMNRVEECVEPSAEVQAMRVAALIAGEEQWALDAHLIAQERVKRLFAMMRPVFG
jgi:hypothetical protein